MWHTTNLTRGINIFLKKFQKKNYKKIIKNLKNSKKEKLTRGTYLTVLVLY